MDRALEIPPLQKGATKKDLNGGFLDLQTGAVYSNDANSNIEVSEEVQRLSNRIKQNFDPTGRLNPGRKPH